MRSCSMSVLKSSLLVGAGVVLFSAGDYFWLQNEFDNRLEQTRQELATLFSDLSRKPLKNIEIEKLFEPIEKGGRFASFEIQDDEHLPVYSYNRKESTPVIGVVERYFEKDAAPLELSLKNEAGKKVYLTASFSARREAWRWVVDTSAFTLFGLLILLYFRRYETCMLTNAKEACRQFWDFFEDPAKKPTRLLTRLFGSEWQRIEKRVTRMHESLQAVESGMIIGDEDHYRDEVTRLYNRDYLYLKFPEYLLASDVRANGMTMLFRIDGLTTANRIVGRDVVDDIFFEFAREIEAQVKEMERALAFRLNGSEFFLLLPNTSTKKAKEMAERFIQAFYALLLDYQLKETMMLYIGICPYRRNDKMSDVMCTLDTAVMNASFENRSQISVCREEQKCGTVSKKKWREILLDVLRNDRLRPTMQPVVNLTDDTEVSYHLRFDAVTEKGTVISYETFKVLLRELDFDSLFMKKVFEKLPAVLAKADKPVSLSVLACPWHESENFLAFEALAPGLRKGYPHTLYFEFPESEIRSFSPMMRAKIAEVLAEHRIASGVEGVEGSIGKYDFIPQLKTVYLKVREKEFLAMDAIDRDFMKKLCAQHKIQLIIDHATLQNTEALKKEGIVYVIYEE